MELVVMMQLAVLRTGIDYSSVLKMNAIRQGGLVCAAMNGLYALYILQHFAMHNDTGISSCFIGTWYLLAAAKRLEDT